MMTQAELKKTLFYDQDTGKWFWIKPPSHNLRLKGQEAGSVRRDGYQRIRIKGRAYYSGRLAFLYMEGYFPDEVDHIDRDPSNDRWSNLRAANSSLNKWNRKTSSTLGYRGVYRVGQKWQVQVGGVYLGVSPTLEGAIRLRDSVALSMAGNFAYLNGESS